MNNPPAFQHYAADFLTETFDLSVDEVGVYIRLLSHAWKHEPVGTLPDDDARLARLAGIDCSLWQQMRPTVLRFFNFGKDGRWHHPALRIQYEDRRRLAKARAESAKHRWHKDGEPEKKQKQNATCKPLESNTVNAIALQNVCKPDAIALQNGSLQSSTSTSCTFLEESTKEPVAIPPPAVAETKPEKTPKVERKPQERDWLWDWFTEFCALTKSFPGKRLGKAINALWKDNPTLEQCHHFERYWNEIDWRGVEGRLPAPEQVCSEWGKAQRWETIPDIEPAQPSLPGNALAIVPRNGNGHQPMQLSFQVQNELLRQHKEQQSKAEIAEHVQRMNENQEKYAIKKRW